MPQKDPAMLWYWSDWNSGTILLSRFLKGCYIDVLNAEFNNGPLSLEEIKICLGSDFGSSWPAIQKKFKQTAAGLFFNERLEREKQKRIEFTESRRMNRKKTYDTSYDKHMIHHMENRDENINRNEIKDKGSGEKEKIKMPFTSENFRVLWQNWKQYRLQEFRKKYKSIQSEQAALSHLANISGGIEETAFEIISQSIANQWQGIFEQKNQSNGSSKNRKSGKVTGADLDQAFAKRYS